MRKLACLHRSPGGALLPPTHIVNPSTLSPSSGRNSPGDTQVRSPQEILKLQREGQAGSAAQLPSFLYQLMNRVDVSITQMDMKSKQTLGKPPVKYQLQDYLLYQSWYEHLTVVAIGLFPSLSLGKTIRNSLIELMLKTKPHCSQH